MNRPTPLYRSLGHIVRSMGAHAVLCMGISYISVLAYIPTLGTYLL